MSALRLYRRFQRNRKSANARLNWVLTLSGILFAGLTLNRYRDTDPLFYRLLNAIIPLTGLVLSLTAVFGAEGARNVIRVLKRKWKKLEEEREFGSPGLNKLAIIPGILLAIPLLMIWTIILIVILIGKI